MARKRNNQTAGGKSENKLSVKYMMAKARELTSDVEHSAAMQALSGEENVWRKMQAILAPYDPRSLLKYIEITPHLRPAISAMAQNVDGFGYRSVPAEAWMDSTDDEEVLKKIIEALTVEQWVREKEDELAAQDERGELEEKIRSLREKGAKKRTIKKYESKIESLEKQDPDDDEPTIEENAAALLVEMRAQMIRERYLFKNWFEQCCSDMDFVELRKAVRSDVESHGWGAIEWLRDKWGRLKRLQYVPAYTVRPLEDMGEFVTIEETDAVTPLSQNRTVMVDRKFRIYVQQVGSAKIYYKSPRDPRVVSQKTGEVYDSVEALRAPENSSNPGEGKDAMPANELLWIAKHDPTTPCAPPDWIGNLVNVLGQREADETNFFYLSSNAIPSGLLFVHGGSIKKDVRERLEHRIQREVAGPENTGKILIVEARPGGNTAPGEKTMLPGITYQSLRESHTNDALFDGYDKRCADRVGASFRLSPILRGYTPSNLNRATAFAALFFAEQQVFSPLRNAFDWMMNKILIPELGFRFIRFASNSPPTTSTEELGEFIKSAAPHGAFTPEELRSIAGEALNREVEQIDEPWTKQPIQLTLNGVNSVGGGGDKDGSLNQRMRNVETKVAQIFTEELRADGFENEITAQYLDEDEFDEKFSGGSRGDK